MKSLIDLSALGDFEENLVMQLRIMKEIEWDNDKLIVGLESNDSGTFNNIKEISGHDYNWRDLLIPFTANYENQFLKLIFSTDNTVNYRGFSIDNLELFYKGCIKGDLNYSSTVSVHDIVMLVDLILDDSMGDAIRCNSDINEDGKIDIFDLILMVEIILNN